jgi:hypothetical protein
MGSLPHVLRLEPPAGECLDCELRADRDGSPSSGPSPVAMTHTMLMRSRGAIDGAITA